MTDKVKHIAWAAEAVAVFQQHGRTGDEHPGSDPEELGLSMTTAPRPSVTRFVSYLKLPQQLVSIFRRQIVDRFAEEGKRVSSGGLLARHWWLARPVVLGQLASGRLGRVRHAQALLEPEIHVHLAVHSRRGVEILTCVFTPPDTTVKLP